VKSYAKDIVFYLVEYMLEFFQAEKTLLRTLRVPGPGNAPRATQVADIAGFEGYLHGQTFQDTPSGFFLKLIQEIVIELFWA